MTVNIDFTNQMTNISKTSHPFYMRPIYS